MSNVDAVKGVEKVYAEATSTLTELSKSRHQASQVYFRLFQGLIIWMVIFYASLFFSLPTMRDFNYRESKSEVNPIDLVSVAVVVISAVKCITLGTALFKVQITLSKASKNFYKLSQSLYGSQIRTVSYDK